MSNKNLEKLAKALQILGQNEQIRSKLLAELKAIEQSLDYSADVREDVTGPIVDALFSETGPLQKQLSTGFTFRFHYTSKITRDFVMSTPDKPDHVWEPQTTKLLLYLSKGVQHVIIGGAYLGDHAILVADQIKANGGICHAFEPNTENAMLLTENALLNDLDNIRVHQVALWDENDVSLRLVGNDAYATSEAVTDQPSQAQAAPILKTTTIDHYVSEHSIYQSVGLIMLDIEGAEYKALLGAEQQLSLPVGEAPNIIFEVHRHYVDWSNGLENTQIIRHLAHHGYHVYAIRDFHSNYPMGDTPIELIPVDSVYVEGPPHGFNMLAIKDRALIDTGPFRICYNVSPKLLLHKNPALHHPLDGLQ